MKNEKLDKAIYVLNSLPDVMKKHDFLAENIDDRTISIDDPWVAAALGCVDDADIPDVALEFFLADVKSGYYDLPNFEPPASP